MNIITFSKVLKFRLFTKKALSAFIDSAKIYTFRRTESVEKLLSFKDISFILTDEESAYCFKDFFLNLSSRNDIDIHLVVFYFSKEFKQNKVIFKNSTFIHINPDTDYSKEENILSFSKILEKQINKPIPRKSLKNTTIKTKSHKPISKNVKAILIGVSTGGPKALRKLLPELTRVTKLPIIIVQHILKNYTDAFVMTLNSISKTKVLKVHEGLAVTKNLVYVAPGGTHTTVMKNNGKVVFKFDDSPPEESVKPSVNFLFRSAADVYGKDVVAIVLTGMGKDGSDGARKLSNKGAYIIAQDEISSDVWSMPYNVIQKGCVNKVLPLTEISAHISSILSNH